MNVKWVGCVGWVGWVCEVFFLLISKVYHKPKIFYDYNWMILLSVEKVLDKGLFFLYLFVFEMEAFIKITRSRFSESQNF